MKRGPGTGRKDQITAAAIELFAEKGFHATSVRDITQLVGMSKAGLYSSFNSKEEVLEEIYYSVIAGMLEELDEIVTQSISPPEKLRRAMVAQVKGVAQSVRELTIYYRERHHLMDDAADRVSARRRAYQEMLEAIITEGIESGCFRPVDVQVMAYGIVGMCAWTYQWFRADGRLSSEDVGSLYADVVICGLSRTDSG